MRSILLAALLSLGVLALSPELGGSKAQAWWRNRGYYAGYGGYGYGGYGYGRSYYPYYSSAYSFYPGYTYSYAYPRVNSFYYSGVPSYGYSSYYPSTTYGYGSYYTPRTSFYYYP